MSGFGLALNRPNGRALIIGSAACRASITPVLQHLGFQAAELDDPYAAMAEICQRPLAYRAVVLSLASVYREELPIVSAIKTRYSHIELWLSNVDGRAAALAEASRLGADGLLADDGLHRFATSGADAVVKVAATAGTSPRTTPKPPTPPPTPHALPQKPNPETADLPLVDAPAGEPVLTAEELRALLQEPPLGHPEHDHQ